MDTATNLAKLGKTGYKLYNKYTSGGNFFGSSGTSAASTYTGSAGPTVGAGTAGGNPGLAAASANTGPGWGALGAGAAFFALAAFNAGKIYEGFTGDRPAMGLIGSEVFINSKNNYKSKAGFDFYISAKDFKGAHEAASLARNYLDEVFTEIQGNTSVNVNDVIKYAEFNVPFNSGGTPMDMVNTLVKEVQKGIQTGTPLTTNDPNNNRKWKKTGKLGDYRSGTKRVVNFKGRGAFDAGNNSNNNKGEFTANPAQKLTGRAAYDNEITKSYENKDVWTGAPGFKGDANYEIQEFSPAINGSGSMANSTGFKKLKEVGEDIEYQQTLANLSGIELSEDETKYLDEQRDIAVDRAMVEIEDTFGEQTGQLIAQQVYNLGGNALGGTIGQSFMKKWQEKEAKMKTDSLADIESMYLGTKEQRLSEKKQHQMDLWGMDYDKYKFDTGINFQWDQNALDRSLQERIGSQEINAWDDANKWSGLGSLAGSVVGSDWFGDWLTS